MKRLVRWSIGAAWLAGVALSPVVSKAQEKSPAILQTNRGYDVSRETVLQGTVLRHSASSTIAPLGPHVVLQTASGQTDVHLGNAKLLENNHFTLASGDTIRVVG